MTQTSTTPEGSKKRDWKLKEKVTPDQLITLLRQWLEAIEQKQDFEFQLKEGKCQVPRTALDEGRVVVEYELDEGEYEFEIELKWKASGTESH